MLTLCSSDAGSIGVANPIVTPNRPAFVSLSVGVVRAIEGGAIVVKLVVRFAAVTPPRAPRRPGSTTTR